MAREHGFKFTIKGEVFVPQKSKAGADVVAAYNEAVGIRERIQAELLDVPASIEISEPVVSTRLVPEVKAKVGSTAAEDGPTPALDLPSRKKQDQPSVAAE